MPVDMWQFVKGTLLLSLIICQCMVTVATENVRMKRAVVPAQKLGVAGNESPPDTNFNRASLNKVGDTVPKADPAAADFGGKKGKHGEGMKKKIAESVECAADVKRFCSDKINSNNFLVLDCLQNDEMTSNKLSSECQHYLWEYKLRLTKDGRFDNALAEACAPELDQITECKSLPEGEGQRIPCLIEHFEEIESKPCSTFLNKMASIIFSDHRFMDFFMKDCKHDIREKRCGRLEPMDGNEEDLSPHSQGKTVACLNEHRKELNKPCKKALLKVAELQSEDYHLDRPLYYACKSDRENLCPTVTAGEGAVFKCLYQHLGDEKLSVDCRTKLEERQALIAEDIKADKSFYKACKRDIQQNECLHHGKGSAEGYLEEDLQRSSVLLCLEKAQNHGKKVEPECLQEMFELRSELMQDYKISPELVHACQAEIRGLCAGLAPGGKTLDCLMKAAIMKTGEKEDLNHFSPQCRAEITELLHIANPGEDIRLDRPLQKACGDVVTKACSDLKSGDGDVITCLLENLDDEDMTDECEDHLLVIQYFAVRDFKLDTHLFRSCRKDALELCNSDGEMEEGTPSVEHGPVIFACLHRHLRSGDPGVKKPSRQCIHEMKRVMRERSRKVQLMPEVEDACIEDLADKCSDDDEHTEVGGEMECLQSNLEDLKDKCRNVMVNFTIEQSEDIEMDRLLMKACAPMIKDFCGDLLHSDAMPNDVLECLIKHKNHHDMDEKCAAGIEHHQIISLKDFRFNHKFRESCKGAVDKFCSNKKTKFEVVACLSEHVRNDTLTESVQRIDHRCQKQLRFELLQRDESINLDPNLKNACQEDIVRFCQNKGPGEGEVLECLRSHKKRLNDNCHNQIFKRERDEAVVGDYSLHHTCKLMIKEYCDEDSDEAGILNCLQDHIKELDGACRKVVQRRQIERSRDFRLNPHLQRACRLDIPKFCADVFGSAGEKELEGRVIDCLKKKFATARNMLSSECELEIKSRVREAAMDINLNPILLKTCKKDIKQLCLEEISNVRIMQVKGEDDEYDTHGNGVIVECLKRNFQKLKDFDCKKEVAFMIAESKIDVQVDPVLHTACQEDLVKHCREIKQGQGRQMSCLLAYLETDADSLKRTCREMLQRRKNLWEYAAQVAPIETFSEMVDQVVASPARNYFIAVLFSFIGVVLIMGVMCGRVTKRVRAEEKNK